MTGILGIDLPKLFYTSGETLRGSVIFHSKISRKIFGAHLHFFGYEFCENSILSDIPYSKKWILDGFVSLYGNDVLLLKIMNKILKD